MRVGSLFSGVEMFGHAAVQRGHELAWSCEVADFPRSILELRYPGLTIHRDVIGLEPEPVDIIVGGFPCQDLSQAGRGAGLAGARSGLWSEFARIIALLQPRGVVIENVGVLRSRGMDTVLRDLYRAGYRATWDCIPAAAVGAPHLRDRIWIQAWRREFGEPEVGKPVANVTRLPRAGAMGVGGLTELAPAATVKACKAALGQGGLWPTPAARDWKDTGEGRMGRGQLPAVREVERLWPTPRASMGTNHSGGGELATWRRKPSAAAGTHGSDLQPEAIEAALEAGEMTGADIVRYKAQRDPERKGALNPDWVEWLMGMPVGWTDPTCAEPVQLNWSSEHGLARVAENVPLRKQRLTAIGNALVWQVAATRIAQLEERIR